MKDLISTVQIIRALTYVSIVHQLVDGTPIYELNVDSSAQIGQVNTVDKDINTLLHTSMQRLPIVGHIETSLYKGRVKRWGANWIAVTLYDESPDERGRRRQRKKQTPPNIDYDSLGGGVWG